MREELPINSDTLKAFYGKANRKARRAMSTLLSRAWRQHAKHGDSVLKRTYMGNAIVLLNEVL